MSLGASPTTPTISSSPAGIDPEAFAERLVVRPELANRLERDDHRAQRGHATVVSRRQQPPPNETNAERLEVA